jgi:hypothetical protein
VLPALSVSPGEGVRVEPRSLVDLVQKDHRDADISVARVWTGHQAEFWHPGIMAKYLAAGALAGRLRAGGGRAEVTWLVVDQDANEAWKVPYPGLVKDLLTRGVWTLPFQGMVSATKNPYSAETPACALPVVSVPGDLRQALWDLEPAAEFVAEGLRAIGEALRRHGSERNLARQVTGAVCDLLEPWCRPDRVVYASELWREAGFARVVEEMRRDPVRCVEAYNRAVAGVPRAHVRALRVEGARVELPLWRMPGTVGRARRAVWSDELAGVKLEELAPRALLMTAVVRSSLCDLFIHGTGGGVYDRITERWFAEWMPDVSLAPTGVVTATRRLPFDVKVRTPEEIARARWRAHAARHSPGVLGDEAGEARRRALVEGVRTARARGVPVRGEFEALHRFLAEQRARHGERVRELEREAEEAARDVAVAGVVHERAWPFPLYPKEVLDGLKAEVDRAVGGATA